MKLQHLAVIFVIIIAPISLVMSSYINNQIEAIEMQTAYDRSLVNATYDAVKAFQLNTTNNKYSSISDSKIRDIEASINTFYNSLNNSMLEYSQTPEDLQNYTPAILFTLYDGYYIYSAFDNVYSTTGEGEDEKIHIDLEGKNYENGLRPFVNYSAKYKLSSGEIIVVNYTLDNAITVYGDFGGTEGYVTKSGYLINPNDVTDIDTGKKELTYNGVRIKPEELTEHLITLDENGIPYEGDYHYIFHQNKKIYEDGDGTGNYFWYDNYMKTPVNDPYIRAYVDSTKKYSSNGKIIMSTSAYDYYYEAQEFSNWVVNNLGGITQADTIKIEDGITTIGNDQEYLSENTGNIPIFDTTKNKNNPMLSDSAFNNHRLAVIRKSIETNLNTIISRYHSTQLYDYAMPIMADDDWYRILNNVSMVTFMQGMSIGYRYYNNYAIVTNNVNKEVVKAENVYIVTEEGNNREYHQPGCKKLLEKVESGQVRIVGAYPTAGFQRQSIRMSENNEDDIHFYFQSRGVEDPNTGIVNGKKVLTGCYNCIVNATANYDIDDIIAGNDLIDFVNSEENGGNNSVSFSASNSAYKEVRTAYLTALARERKDLYKSNFDLSDLN